MNEWALAAEIKSWWDSELTAHPEWTLSYCRVEETVSGSKKRSDLFIQSKKGPLLCGELRLPDHVHSSPWHPDNMMDAVQKATTHGARWAFTSDATVFLLIDTSLTGPLVTRVVEKIDLVHFTVRAELDSASFLETVKTSWVEAIQTLAPTISGLAVPKGMAPDELFINSLRALLSAPVAAIREELNVQRKNKDFEHQLVTWMVDEQGWTHVPAQWEAEMLRAAQLTAYVFTTRLMFYEALRRSQPSLPPVHLPQATAGIAQATLKEYFREARELSGDYETIFTWDKVCLFALLGDAAVSGWIRVIGHLAVFDVSHIGYDILGKMFERLIDPHERYRWGQHYTSPDVVDLMLSFAIPDGKGKILDPATGGGTFLVRAYVRKRLYEPTKTHQDILRDLYGLDTSAFAASVATVNLAIRHLDFVENYPQISAQSFFQVAPNQVFMALPAPKRVQLDHKTASVSIDKIRALVCNPPLCPLA